MQFFTFSEFSVLSLLVVAVCAHPFSQELNVTNAQHDLERRQSYSNVRLTWYNADGTGACGSQVENNQYIVALDSDLYDGGANCHRSITITANGKSAEATIQDKCPGCPYGGLDLSEGLFEYFADPSVGVLTGSWRYN